MDIPTSHVVSWPTTWEYLYFYLVVSEEAVSTVLIKGPNDHQILIYFISKALVRLETWYQKIDRETMSLVTTSVKLYRYFLTYTIIVRTETPLKQVLQQPNLFGRLEKWYIKIYEFDASYESRKASKVQLFVDFIEEITPCTLESAHTWVVSTNGLFNSLRSGDMPILES